MYKPQNVDEYMELSNPTIFEIQDPNLRAADEGEGDTQFSTMTSDLRTIEAGSRVSECRFVPAAMGA